MLSRDIRAGRGSAGACTLRRGFTLIELIVVFAIMSAIGAVAIGGFRGYTVSMDHEGTANSIVSELRNAQQRALTQGQSFCVRFSADGRSWTTYRAGCGTGTLIKRGSVEGGAISFTEPRFQQNDGTTSRDAIFYARGVATGGTLEVAREGRDKKFTITVERLTSRVSMQ